VQYFQSADLSVGEQDVRVRTVTKQDLNLPYSLSPMRALFMKNRLSILRTRIYNQEGHEYQKIMVDSPP
jgi:hypothetical protein